MQPPPFERVPTSPPAFLELPGYAPSSFSPQILVQPLEDRISYLDGQSVGGLIYVKAAGHGWKLDQVEASLVLSEEDISGSIERLWSSAWNTVHATSLDRHAESSRHPGSPTAATYPEDGASIRSSEKQRQVGGTLDTNDGLPFSIPLGYAVLPGLPLPGCIHLLEAGLGQVVWHIRVRVRGVNLLSTPKAHLGGPPYISDSVQVEEDVEIHLTPCKAQSVPAIGDENFPQAGPSSSSSSNWKSATSTITGRDSHISAGSACKMIVSTVETSNTESIAVGVEISSESKDLDEESIKWLKGLRRVRIQWWRRVRIVPDEERHSPAKGSFGTSFRQRESLTLLHKSGKLCRYSSNRQRPIRLLFELPPLRNVLFNTHSAASLGGVGCGDVSQETPRHQVDFFVRIIVESRGGGTSTPSVQASGSSSTGPQPFAISEGDPVVLEQEVRILPPTWNQLLPHVVTVTDADGSDRLDIAQALREDEVRGMPDSMMNEDARNRAYRLKGSDIVGSTGTFRQEGLSATSSSGNPPPFEPKPHLSEERDQADPPPFSDSTGSSEDALPSFDESERHNQSRLVADVLPGSRASTSGSVRTPTPAQLTGELAGWREYDGYETFSAPPPAAWASLGLSGSMDPPSADDVDNEAVHGDMALGGADERVRLMEHLGLGEGTRVIDTQEDMPPGFDEPSLPSLPNAVMPHHLRAMQRRAAHSVGEVTAMATSGPLDESAPPPAFSRVMGTNAPGEAGNRESSGNRQVLPPPSFADSEAAEARGIAATGPVPITTTAHETTTPSSPPDMQYHLTAGIPSAPPVYSDDSHAGHNEAPPGYSRAH